MTTTRDDVLNAAELAKAAMQYYLDQADVVGAETKKAALWYMEQHLASGVAHDITEMHAGRGRPLHPLVVEVLPLTIGMWQSRRRDRDPGCICFVLEEEIAQPFGECPWHGDEEQATYMSFTELEEGESWANPM